jgi:hypothetical protein
VKGNSSCINIHFIHKLSMLIFVDLPTKKLTSLHYVSYDRGKTQTSVFVCVCVCARARACVCCVRCDPICYVLTAVLFPKLFAPQYDRILGPSRRIRIFFRPAIFWDITQGRMVILYHRCHLEPILCPETWVKVYHSTLLNPSEERRSHQQREGTLKSRTILTQGSYGRLLPQIFLIQH